MREVVVIGVGLHKFGRFREKTFVDLGSEAAVQSLEDAGIEWPDMQVAIYSHVFDQMPSPGERVLRELGLSGLPIVNVENACSAGHTAIWIAHKLISACVYDIAIVVGAEKMPRGAVSVSQMFPERLLGTDMMMGLYGLRARKYIEEYGVPIEALAQVSVKNHRNGNLNPDAQYTQKFTLEEVLGSRMIADPLTLYQCCPTTDGGAAVVLCAKEMAAKYSNRRAIKIVASALNIATYEEEKTLAKMGNTIRSAKEAYRQASILPKDIDVAELHDAATIGEILQTEAVGLSPEGKGWKFVLEGKTEINGEIPINPSGGLQAQGHPLGATGIRQVVQLARQLRYEAGEMQVAHPKYALAQCAGAGGVTSIHVLSNLD